MVEKHSVYFLNAITERSYQSVVPFLKGAWIFIKPLGTAFINLLVMVVVPLIMASLIIGTASLGDLRKLGRIGVKTVAFYLIATALAVALGLGAGLSLGPGRGMDESIRDQIVAKLQSILPEYEPLNPPGEERSQADSIAGEVVTESSQET